MDIGEYQHNYDGYYEKPTYQMYINRRENNHYSRWPYKPCGNSLISYLSLLVKNFEVEIQPSKDHVDTDNMHI